VHLAVVVSLCVQVLTGVEALRVEDGVHLAVVVSLFAVDTGDGLV